jgi:putative transposase
MACRRNVAEYTRYLARTTARSVGARSHPVRRHYRQPERQNGGKGGPLEQDTIGYDAAKHIKGRKRHILVDTNGLLLAVVVHSAKIQDRDGAKLLLAGCKDCFPRLSLIWADGGYRGQLIEWVKQECGWTLQIVEKPAEQKGFLVLPRRWVVERTFAWLGRYRRLAKDYDLLPETGEAWIHIAMTHIMLKRLAK